MLVRLYQVTLSPVLGRQCRFVPTCSCYAHEALDKHGLKALPLIGKRLLRCAPWSKTTIIEYDPVPEKK